ncbi:MAG: hypothetical protein FWG04_05910 [Desulfovibrionaceae bacterium]|nr:hypothetical protein [Desulfovibrionaceae bacterium]
MTKQQPSATSLPPSKLCRLLIIAFALKLTVLGVLILEPVLPGESSSFSLAGLFTDSDTSGRSAAQAATGESAGAPPALAPVLPEQNISPTMPQASAPAGSTPEPARVLPSIGERPAASATAPGAEPQAAPGATNSTAQTDGAELRDVMARRQEDLARKEQELRVLESDLTDRLAKMQMLENRLSTMLKDAEETNDAKFRHLVDVLSNMKSRQAAVVLETLDPKIAVRVLAGMRGRQAGEILTFVRPEIAARLSESLARMQLPLE